MTRTIETETVIVGSGPGGATVARELAKAGKDVVLLEKGKTHIWPIGRVWAYATMYDIKRSKDGVLVRRGITTGGSTMLYSANSYDPPAFIKDELGIDLTEEVAETKEELHIRAVPEEFYGDYAGTRRLMEAADQLGHPMKPQERFIDYTRCDSHCDRCLFGCKLGAKWTAREYVEDAVNSGATFINRCDVERVLISGGAAEGVTATLPGGEKLTVRAERVVLAAGGIGTPMILQRSGIEEAGTHFFTDPMSIVVGVVKEGSGTFREITFTVANHTHVGRFMIGNVGAVNGFVAQLFKLNFPYLLKAPKIKKVCGLFVKVCDEPTGRVTVDGKLHKAFSDRDEANMKDGVDIATKILVGAGVDPDTIAVAKGIGGHPGGTAAIGRVVGPDLQTKVRNLYVCDNSVMPHSGGVPPVLTLIALAKKTARSTFLH